MSIPTDSTFAKDQINLFIAIRDDLFPVATVYSVQSLLPPHRYYFHWVHNGAFGSRTVDVCEIRVTLFQFWQHLETVEEGLEGRQPPSS